MRVDCPSCAANYDIPDHLLVKGRQARCARCGVRFVPSAADPDPIAAAGDEVGEPVGGGDAADDVPATTATTAASEAEPQAHDRLSVQSLDPRPPLALQAAWGASIILLLLCGAGTVVWRDAIVQYWPAGAVILGGGGQ